MRKILIFGGTSFIGAHFLRAIKGHPFEVFAVGRKSSSQLSRINDFLPKEKILLVDELEESLTKLNNDFDIVINFVTNYGRTSMNKVSDLMGLNVIFPVKLVDKFSKATYINIDTSLPRNLNLYAFTKGILREGLKEYYKGSGKIFNLKLERIYGEGDDQTKFLTSLVTKLKKNEAINMTLGEQKIDFIHVTDCVNAILHTILNEKKFDKSFEEFEIGFGQTVVLRELVEFLKKQLNSHSVINYGAVPYRENEKMDARVNLDKLSGWSPKISIYDIDFNSFY